MPWHGDLRAETGRLRHREDLRIIELIQAQNFRLPPTLKRAGMGAEIIIIQQIKPKDFRRNAQKDCLMTVC